MTTARSATVAPDPSFGVLFRELAPALPGGSALLGTREHSFARFEAQGLPTRRVEDWRYTDIARGANRPVHAVQPATVTSAEVARYLAGGPQARRLVFVNGLLQPAQSHAGGLPDGVTVASLDTLLAEAPERVLAAVNELEDGRSFTALNTAFLGHGAWIEVAAGVEVALPLQLLFLTVGATELAINHPRVIVRLGRGAKLTLIETHAGMRDGQGLTNLVCQVALEPLAELRHDRLQLVQSQGSLLGKLAGVLGDGARYVQTVATIGGGLVRNETDIRVAGKAVECLLNGVYMPTGEEHVDNFIRIHHQAPGSHSDQFYKGVIDGNAHAAFQGKIIVHQEAQQTIAFQANNNLLLSDDAELDTKPELEIYADDVKCSHGATAGDLDALALFYLRSRGVDPGTARTMLTYAFAAEVFERFTDPAIGLQAKRAALGRLPGGPPLLEML